LSCAKFQDFFKINPGSVYNSDIDLFLGHAPVEQMNDPFGGCAVCGSCVTMQMVPTRLVQDVQHVLDRPTLRKSGLPVASSGLTRLDLER
jgi:hypothetical protein